MPAEIRSCSAWQRCRAPPGLPSTSVRPMGLTQMPSRWAGQPQLGGSQVCTAEHVGGAAKSASRGAPGVRSLGAVDRSVNRYRCGPAGPAAPWQVPDSRLHPRCRGLARPRAVRGRMPGTRHPWHPPCAAGRGHGPPALAHPTLGTPCALPDLTTASSGMLCPWRRRT